MKELDYKQVIEKLQLKAHPEGGYYKETFKSDEYIPENCLSDRYGARRAFYTSIYFMLTKKDISKFHRIKSDEIWHFYFGDPLELYVIKENGKLETELLGNNLLKGEVPQILIRKNQWFAAKIAGNNFSLLGCSVSPGFEFEDFEMARREQLSREYPALEKIIREFT